MQSRVWAAAPRAAEAAKGAVRHAARRAHGEIAPRARWQRRRLVGRNISLMIALVRPDVRQRGAQWRPGESGDRRRRTTEGTAGIEVETTAEGTGTEVTGTITGGILEEEEEEKGSKDSRTGGEETTVTGARASGIMVTTEFSRGRKTKRCGTKRVGMTESTDV